MLHYARELNKAAVCVSVSLSFQTDRFRIMFFRFLSYKLHSVQL